MKSLKLILLAAGIILSAHAFAQQHSSTKDVLTDKKMQDSIMMRICSSKPMMENMMAHMMQSKQAMQMMSENKPMMDKMMGTAAKDTSMCKMMMDKMMGMMEMMGKDKMKMQGNSTPKPGDPLKDTTMHMDNMK